MIIEVREDEVAKMVWFRQDEYGVIGVVNLDLVDRVRQGDPDAGNDLLKVFVKVCRARNRSRDKEDCQWNAYDEDATKEN
jgi:hypothetical protein